MLANLYFAFLPLSITSLGAAAFGYFLIGLSYSLYGTSSWPMIPYVVDNHVIGTAYGIGFACQSLGTIFGPIVVGWLSDAGRTNGITDYFWVNVFFAMGALSALLMNVAVTWIDMKTGGALMSPNKRISEFKPVKTEDETKSQDISD